MVSQPDQLKMTSNPSRPAWRDRETQWWFRCFFLRRERKSWLTVCETNINGHFVLCFLVSRGLLKRLMSSKDSLSNASWAPVESLWDQFCAMPRTEAVFRGENFRPPRPLYAELHLCFVFSIFLSISTFQWAYYLNKPIPKRPGYVNKFLSVFSGQLRTLRLPQKCSVQQQHGSCP